MNRNHRNQFKALPLAETNGAARKWLIMAMAGLASIIVAASLAPVGAQTLGKGFAGFAADNNEPIDIESDTLEVNDASKIAIFSGNVKAVQGTMTMRTKELHVTYTGGDGGLGSGSEISKIKAQGKVLITTDKKQTATADRADFDVKEQTVVISGNVVLSQGEGSVLKGDRLVINLKTGQSRFENRRDAKTGKPVRVKGLFMPKKKNDKKKTKKNGEPSPWAAEIRRPSPSQ